MRFSVIEKFFSRKERIIYLSILLVILFELLVGISVYNKIGSERVFISLFRTFIQVALLFSVSGSNSKTPLYLFVFYHVLVGLEFLYKTNCWLGISLLFGFYHIFIALMAYFSEEVSNYFRKKIN